MKPMVRDIQTATARHFGESLSDWMEPKSNRYPGTLMPHQVAMFLAREMTEKSYPLLAERFWRKDHTTVMYGVRRVRTMISKYPSLAATVETIREELAA